MGILCSRNNKVNDLLNCLPTYGFYKNYIDQDNTGYLYLELPEIWQKEKNSFILKDTKRTSFQHPFQETLYVSTLSHLIWKHLLAFA